MFVLVTEDGLECKSEDSQRWNGIRATIEVLSGKYMFEVEVVEGLRKGTNGGSTNGSLQICLLFDRGTFWVPPSTYFNLPKSARAYLFPNICRK